MSSKMLIISTLLVSFGFCGAENRSKGVDPHPQLPRGAPLAKAQFYSSSVEFSCLDGSGIVPALWVNDDYCDCDDGSDEPGTSACEAGHFHCINLGHRPEDVLSSRVNDQVCDCCDGSDEYSGLTQCPNICEEMGKLAKEESERLARVQKEGFEKRTELIRDGQRLREENARELEDLKKRRDELEPEKTELDNKKKAAEELESASKKKHEEAWKAEQDAKKAELEKTKAQEAFSDLDANKDGKISTNEIMVRMEFDKDEDGAVTEAEAIEILADEHPDLEKFLGATWETIKDTYKSPNKNELTDEDLDADDFDEEKYPKVPEDEKDEMPPYDDETIQLIDDADLAREEFEKMNKQFTDLENQIKDIDKFMEVDLGPLNEFASLKGKCYDLHDLAYIYTLCLFDKTSQSSKAGGSSISLGRWGHWSGPPNNKYARMKYTGGQNCWNGPERLTEVHFKCGNEDQLLSASEPARCEYKFEFASPVACTEPTHPDHTEL